MKKFLLFSGDNHYPMGGWRDFLGSFDTKEEAVAAVPLLNDWYQVVDLEAGKIVAGSRGWHGGMEE